MKREVPNEVKEEALLDGWDASEVEKGYAIFDGSGLGGASHIEKIDMLDAFESDEEAAEYAEKHDGVKIIHDLPDCIPEEERVNCIDTEENREIIRQFIKDTYGVDWNTENK